MVMCKLKKYINEDPNFLSNGLAQMKDEMKEDHIFVEWSCANKSNESVGTLNSGRMVCILLWLKCWSARGASHHPALMGNFPIISHTFLVLSTQWMSSP